MDKNIANVSSDLIRGNVDTIILKCLQIGDMYGLEICDLVKRASGGTYVLKQPTLYSSLKRLETQKLIRGYWKDSTIGGRRHYYKLADAGLARLSDKKGSWSDAKDVIDTLVGDLRQRREEILEEQANDVAKAAERIANAEKEKTESIAKSSVLPSIDSMMEANDAPPKILIDSKEKNSSEPRMIFNTNSLIAEILREPSEEYTRNSAPTLASVPSYDPKTESDNVTTIPLSNKKETPVEALKPYVFNADNNLKTAVAPVETNEHSEVSKTVESNDISAVEANKGIPEDMFNISLSFKPKSAAEKLNKEGEILEVSEENEQVPRFAKYLSPDDYARVTTTARSATHVAPKIASTNDIAMRPFKKQGIYKFGAGYIFAGRLRFVGSIISAIVVGCVLFVVRLATAPHTEGELAFFTIAFMILAGYLAVHAVLFLSYPKSTHKAELRWENAVLRLGLFVALAVVILGVNALGGLNTDNAFEYIIYWVIPCILASIIVIEGFLRFLLVKLKLFTT